MIMLLKVIFQFALHASDPHWTCELTHRDPGMPATFYLYCTQKQPNGIEISSVGKYVPDAPQPIKVTP